MPLDYQQELGQYNIGAVALRVKAVVLKVGTRGTQGALEGDAGGPQHNEE